jgi:hypothetical protein
MFASAVFFTHFRAGQSDCSLTAGATQKAPAKFGCEQIIFMSGVRHVRTEWRQVQI